MTETEYYLALKARDAALGVADPAAAAAALAGATETRARDIPRRDARSVLYLGGGYARIFRRVYHSTLPDPNDATQGAALTRTAFDAAVTALMVLDSDSAVIEAADADKWGGVQAVFGLLVFMDDVTAAEHDALLALRDETVRILERDPTADDVIAARGQF